MLEKGARHVESTCVRSAPSSLDRPHVPAFAASLGITASLQDVGTGADRPASDRVGAGVADIDLAQALGHFAGQAVAKSNAYDTDQRQEKTRRGGAINDALGMGTRYVESTGPQSAPFSCDQPLVPTFAISRTTLTPCGEPALPGPDQIALARALSI